MSLPYSTISCVSFDVISISIFINREYSVRVLRWKFSSNNVKNIWFVGGSPPLPSSRLCGGATPRTSTPWVSPRGRYTKCHSPVHKPGNCSPVVTVISFRSYCYIFSWTKRIHYYYVYLLSFTSSMINCTSSILVSNFNSGYQTVNQNLFNDNLVYSDVMCTPSCHKT